MSSNLEVLVSDVYSGYKKSITAANEIRAEEGRPPIRAAYCNAHARREFLSGDDSGENLSTDAEFMVDQYKEIYKLEAAAKSLSADGATEKREQMQPFFEALKEDAQKKIGGYSNKSGTGKAYGYFLNNYDGLTL